MEALNGKGYEYYSEMPKHIRKRWSDNFEDYARITKNERTKERFLEKNHENHEDFIAGSFLWASSNEGSFYWDLVSNEKYDLADLMYSRKNIRKGTMTFVLLLFSILCIYALVWIAFFKKENPVKNNLPEKFVSVTVWEKPDTMDMVYADKNYNGE